MRRSLSQATSTLFPRYVYPSYYKEKLSYIDDRYQVRLHFIYISAYFLTSVMKNIFFSLIEGLVQHCFQLQSLSSLLSIFLDFIQPPKVCTPSEDSLPRYVPGKSYSLPIFPTQCVIATYISFKSTIATTNDSLTITKQRLNLMSSSAILIQKNFRRNQASQIAQQIASHDTSSPSSVVSIA